MNAPIAGDRASSTVLVEVPPEVAFEVFTAEIDRWWRRGPRFRNTRGDRGIIHLEPKLGGRVFESYPDASGTQQTVHQSGTITAWEPPERVVFDWRISNFAPEEKTQVEVTFKPSRSGTLVTVVHSGWASIRPDHPARHGEDPPAFLRQIGLYWGDLGTSFREIASERR